MVTASSSIIVRKGGDLEKEIKEVNTMLKNYCVVKGFIFVDNTNEGKLSKQQQLKGIISRIV